VTTQDLINAGFECSAGILLWMNVIKLYKDKVLRGVAITPTLVFTLWGYWNLYYYPHLNQTLSFLAGILVTIANTTWVVLAIHYYKKGKNNAVRQSFPTC